MGESQISDVGEAIPVAAIPVALISWATQTALVSPENTAGGGGGSEASTRFIPSLSQSVSQAEEKVTKLLSLQSVPEVSVAPSPAGGSPAPSPSFSYRLRLRAGGEAGGCSPCSRPMQPRSPSSFGSHGCLSAGCTLFSTHESPPVLPCGNTMPFCRAPFLPSDTISSALPAIKIPPHWSCFPAVLRWRRVLRILVKMPANPFLNRSLTSF